VAKLKHNNLALSPTNSAGYQYGPGIKKNENKETTT